MIDIVMDLLKDKEHQELGVIGDVRMMRIDGRNIMFFQVMNGVMIQSPMEGLRFVYSEVIKEFPDLKDNTDWKMEAIKRVKKKISSLSSELAVYDFIVEDFKKYNYVVIARQRFGFRKETMFHIGGEEL